MFNLGFGEILIICAVLIIVVGPERLPGLMKSVGKTLRTVRQASRELQATVGLDELLRDDITRPLPPPAARIAPSATVPRDAVPPGSLGQGGQAGQEGNPQLGAVQAPAPASSELAPALSPVLASSTDDGSVGPDLNTAAVVAMPAVVEPATFSPSGAEYDKKSPHARTEPTLAEADGLSISERMLLLHTPKPTEPSPTPDSSDQHSAPAQTGASVATDATDAARATDKGASGGRKGEA